MGELYDFGGYATKNDVRCSDGKTICKDAFIAQDGMTVPMVWQHNHEELDKVIGHALLENRSDGVYAHCKLNETEAGKNAKILVQSGDVNSLSIWANNLQKRGNDILHGTIREVSLVLSGANPGAHIDTMYFAHSGMDESDTDWVIYSPCYLEDDIKHADDEDDEKTEEKPENKEEKMAEETKKDERTVKDVFDELTEEQKNVVYFMIGQALEDAGVDVGGTEEEEDEDMKHNVFYNADDAYNGLATREQANELAHTAIKDARNHGGSLKDSFLAHADEYGISNIEILFPDAKPVNGGAPEFISRDMGWVSIVMNGTKHTPFSRVKSTAANITEDEARARGYIKGNKKKDEVFSLLKRTTDPQTIYKKQKMDRDDQIDITDFDVITWLKGEMRMMLDEELARAVLIGDGRLASSDDKISESHIRPIWKDDDLYSVKVDVSVASTATDEEKGKALIKAAIKSRKLYKGSGAPTLFTTEDMLADMLLIEDGIGHPLYADEAALARAMRVSSIVTVPVMEGQSDDTHGALAGIIVNLNDYVMGADKGGEVNMFDDFDIDYNQMKYLIETRCSGALVKPYSALVLSVKTAE